tara:strand:+ start:2537 stop:2785 length:249 start_codon:yes stop_codon:yes gene_type:complete
MKPISKEVKSVHLPCESVSCAELLSAEWNTFILAILSLLVPGRKESSDLETRVFQNNRQSIFYHPSKIETGLTEFNNTEIAS